MLVRLVKITPILPEIRRPQGEPESRTLAGRVDDWRGVPKV